MRKFSQLRFLSYVLLLMSFGHLKAADTTLVSAETWSSDRTITTCIFVYAGEVLTIDPGVIITMNS